MKNAHNTKQITEGAILTGLFLVLALITYYTPLFILSFIILPTPYIVIYVRTNIKIFIMAVIVGVSALFTLVDPVFTFSMGLTAVLVGGALGLGFSKKWVISNILTAGTLGILVLFLLIFSLMQFVLGIDLLNETMTAFEEAFKSQIATLERIGAPDTQIEEIRSMREDFVENMIVFFPAGLVGGSIVLAYIQVLVNKKILERIGYRLSSLPKFQNWRFPAFFAWFYVIATIALIIQPDYQGYWGMLSANIFMISNYILLIQGLAFGYWFLSVYKGLAKPVIVVLLVLALVLPVANLFIVIIGLIDQLFNLRKIVKNKRE